MSALNPVYDYLHTKTLGDLTSAQDVATIAADASVQEAVEMQAAKHITSLPVMKEGGCIGQVDGLDIVSFIVAAAPKEEDVEAGDEARMEMFHRVITAQQVQHILDFSGRDTYIPLDTHQPVTMALQLMADGTHRVPVVAEDGSVVAVLSQSAVLRHLVGAGSDDAAENHLVRAGLGAFSEQTLGALGLNTTDDLVTISNSETVFSALKKIKEASVSSLAVVDAEGKLIADLSATTLRGLVLDRFPLLLQSVGDFLTAHKPDAVAPMTATAETSFADACTTMASNGIHRLWCVNESGAPIGVFSTTDACRTIAHTTFTV